MYDYILRKDINRISAFTKIPIDKLLKILARKNIVSLLDNLNEEIQAVLIYKLEDEQYVIKHFIIKNDYSGNILDNLYNKKFYIRNRIIFKVNEKHLHKQIFLRKEGFVCVGIEKNKYIMMKSLIKNNKYMNRINKYIV